MCKVTLTRNAVYLTVFQIVLLLCPLFVVAQSARPRGENSWFARAKHAAQKPVTTNPLAQPTTAAEIQAEEGSGFAENTRWQQLAGPETGLATSIVVKGNRVFVGTTGGIFISDDNARNWRRAANSPASFAYGLVTIGNVVLYGTDPFDGIGGVVRSTDNGASWQVAHNGFPNGTGIPYLAVKGNMVFASATAGKVYRSSNQGASWELASNGLPQEPGLNQLAASDFGLLIQMGQVLYRSADGSNWTPLKLALPPNVTAHSPAAIRHFLLLATDGAGVYISDDGGQYWYAPNHGLPAHAVITNLHADQNTVYCTTQDGTLYTSSDFGKTWSPKNADFGTGKTLFGYHSIATSGAALLAATWSGIYRSTDAGYSWQSSNRGFRAAEMGTRFVAQGRRIYAATQGGIWATDDKGEHWTLLNNGLRPMPAGSRGGSGLAVIGRAVFASMQYDGLYRSYNQGRSWERLEAGLPEGFDPFVIRAIGRKIFIGTFEGGAYVSTDNGDTWQQIKDLPADAGFFDFRQVGNAILAGSYGTGMYRSTDNGRTWKPFADGLASDYINDILVMRNAVLVGTDDGIFRLRVDGAGWEEVKSYSQADTNGANGLAYAGGVIYATTYGKGIWASHDQGATWQPMNNGMLTNRSFFFSLIGGDLYVGSSGNGIFVLRNAEHD